MVKLIFAAFLWLLTLSASAHQPDVSSFTLVEQESGKWMLQLNASMTAFQYEVKSTYGDNSYTSPEEFNQLLLSHMKEQITIKVNDKKVTLCDGFVYLGHATTVAIEISGIPDLVEEVFVENKGFQNVHHSQAIFSIVKEGVDRSQFVLNEKNQYQLHVSLKDGQVLLATPSSYNYEVIIPLIAMLSGLLVFLLFRHKKVKTPSIPIYRQTMAKL